MTVRIGEKIDMGPRRTPMLRVNGLLYPMYKSDTPCPVCHSQALDGRECKAKSQCAENGCGTLYNWHDFSSRCPEHDPGIVWPSPPKRTSIA